MLFANANLGQIECIPRVTAVRPAELRHGAMHNAQAARVLLVWLLAAPVAQAGDQGAAPPAARQPGLSQAILQRFDVPGTGYETILMRVEFPPGYKVSRHSHPGPQASYVLQGEATYEFDGEAPQRRAAGESIELPGYAIHGASIGPNGVVLLNTFVVEQGKPLSIPAEGRAPQIRK